MSQQERFKQLIERRADAKVRREAKTPQAQALGKALTDSYRNNGKQRRI